MARLVCAVSFYSLAQDVRVAACMPVGETGALKRAKGVLNFQHLVVSARRMKRSRKYWTMQTVVTL
jgi:hypothetical protein